MDALVGEGVTSFKLFMAYPGVFYSDDGQILRAMQTAAENGGLIMMHAENGIAIDVLVEQALARGETDPRYHGVVRHELLEAEATHRAIKLAQVAGAPLYIVHLSAEQALAEVAQGPRRGLQRRSPRPARSTCSCPPTTSAGPDFEGAKYVCSHAAAAQGAPGRAVARAAHQRPSVVSTDHCPFCFKGQKELGRGDFSKIPNGLPGVEHRMDLLHQGVVDGHISPAPLGRDRLRHPGPDVRALPAQGHDRARAPTPTSSIYDPNAEQVALGARRTT